MTDETGSHPPLPDPTSASGLTGTAGPTDAATSTPGRPLTPEERAQVDEIRRAVDVTDSQAVVQYGLQAQGKLATFADTLLQDVRMKDAEAGRRALSELLERIRELDVDSLAKGSSGSRVPLIGKFLDGLKRFDARYQKLSGVIERLLTGLERTRIGLLRDITVLDKMYDLNVEYLQQLDLYIAAGDEIREDLETRALPAMEVEARTSQDPMVAQQLAEFRQAAARFERRLHDLRLTRAIAIQTAPQIRLIQGNDQSLVEKIQSSVTNTVPLWKNQIVIALSLYRQQQALALQKDVTDATNELLMRNAEMLRTGSARVAREAERGIVDLETLRKVNDDLVATLEETIKIQDEGHAQRIAAEVELLKLQSELKQKLIGLTGPEGRAALPS